jgi:hypothetical protein
MLWINGFYYGVVSLKEGMEKRTNTTSDDGQQVIEFIYPTTKDEEIIITMSPDQLEAVKARVEKILST